MHKYKKIADVRMTTMLFVLCWIAYFTSYLGRLNYSSAMTVMIKEAVLSKSQAGFISMTYFFAYGIGQLLNGFLGDKVNPRKMIFLGLSISGVANLVMGCFADFGIMGLVWCINGYAQSMIWPPIIRIFAEMLEEKTKLRFCINIISTQALGTLASYLLSAAVIYLNGWHGVFFAAAALLIAAALFWDIKFRKIEKFSREFGVDVEKEDNNRNNIQKPQVAFHRILAGSGILVILIPVIVHGVLKDGVTSWVPTYISETFLTSPALSILVTTILPVINLTGAYAAQYLYRKWKKQETKTAACFFMAATVSLLCLWIFGSKSLILTVILLSVITASMMAVNTVFVNLLPLRFEKAGRVSTVSGFLNSMAYLGCAISTFTIGILVQQTGWDNTILSWLGITFLALIMCMLFRNKKIASE
ncbi:MFS transporter [Robinsoniella peoriensis]|uniref:MFS transporter n=1 Tax=Robinsoniella peoriensis TaxID=180332 RepID=UPI001FA749EF|nr:MFS transporter [Robinsoniella peoriensis]